MLQNVKINLKKIDILYHFDYSGDGIKLKFEFVARINYEGEHLYVALETFSHSNDKKGFEKGIILVSRNSEIIIFFMAYLCQKKKEEQEKKRKHE